MDTIFSIREMERAYCGVWTVKLDLSSPMKGQKDTGKNKKRMNLIKRIRHV